MINRHAVNRNIAQRGEKPEVRACKNKTESSLLKSDVGAVALFIRKLCE